MEKQYYVQNYAQGYVGNSMLWWKEGNCGYTCNIKNAKIFEQEELDKMHSIADGTKKTWPKKYIDERIQHHIDMQDCNHKQAVCEDEDEQNDLYMR